MQLLHIDSSVLGTGSASSALTSDIVARRPERGRRAGREQITAIAA